MMTRVAHWIKHNQQERMPTRMVAFDTEARSEHVKDTEVQSWRVGCAIRWRTDLKTGDHVEASVFDNPEQFWRWVAEYTVEGKRTIVWAHNLGYDVRTSAMFDVLPMLGFRLEWCNLDRNISSATWRSDHGSIVLADTWTWVPLPLEQIAPQVGLVKYRMPSGSSKDADWARYCMRDCEILYHVVSDLMAFVRSEGLGNWQPTGAGMAYATWRHKFMSHKVLVHDDVEALEAERIAMHTGRAEAWRHGELLGEKWTEIDLRDAYLTIASEIDLPRNLHMHHRSISVRQFERLRDTFCVLCRVTITTDVPCAPCKISGRHVWPIGTFDTWLWDNELALALEYGAKVKIHEAFTYARAPILQEWARWVLDILHGGNSGLSSVVRTHQKHCGRALIGRLALRTPSWEYWGENINHEIGITHVVMADEDRVTRILAVGNDCLIETERLEGKDSLPMVTGYIMAECRCRLFRSMDHAGFDNIAHVDTDSILCNATGIERIERMELLSFRRYWSVKGTYRRLYIYGPRAYFRDRQRVVAGIPRRAEETAPGVFSDQRWSSLGADLERGQARSVTLTDTVWHLRTSDPRRADAAGVAGRTRAYDVAELSSANSSSAPPPKVGE